MGTSRRFVKDAVLKALRILREMSTSPFFTARELAQYVSFTVGKPISSQSVARHLMLMEVDGEVECDRSNPRLFRWRAIG